MVTVKQSGHKQKQRSSDPLRMLIQKMGKGAVNQLSKEWGVSTNVIYAWRTGKFMPAYVTVLCEAMVRRNKSLDDSNARTFCLVRLPNSRLDDFHKLCEIIDATYSKVDI